MRFSFLRVTVKDCNPSDGPPCSQPAHTESSAPIYDTVEACCERLNWIDIGTCVAVSNVDSDSESSFSSNLFFADAESDSCLQDCESGSVGCSTAPSSTALYNSIGACCAEELWWVEYKYCTSRSIGGYSDGWIVDFQNEKCGMS